MTAGTRVMRIICSAHQWGVRMAACTVGRNYSHDRRMVRRRCMDRIPSRTVTRRTVAEDGDVLTGSNARQAAVGCMT